MKPALQAALITAIAMVAFVYPSPLNATQADCSRTANMQIYSDAFLSKETGDLVGYELALKRTSDSTVESLLFVYEGAPDAGIPLAGRILQKQVTIQGNWIERQIEYPSKKEIVVTHPVKIDAAIDSRSFTGTIKIGDLVTPDKIRLKHVSRIWMCKK
jgi:hypothetical protein